MTVVGFSCSHARGLARIQKVIAEIEAVYAIRVVARGLRMIADIGDSVLRFEEA